MIEPFEPTRIKSCFSLAQGQEKLTVDWSKTDNYPFARTVPGRRTIGDEITLLRSDAANSILTHPTKPRKPAAHRPIGWTKVSYTELNLPSYSPSTFALTFMIFIKLANGEQESHKTSSSAAEDAR